MVTTPKYRYYSTGNKIIAVSSYAGKTVKGYAKCHPSDNFDPEVGKKLATLRCAQKIAEKRFLRAANCEAKAKEAVKAAELHYRDMGDYRTDAAIAWDKADNELRDYVKMIKGE